MKDLLFGAKHQRTRFIILFLFPGIVLFLLIYAYPLVSIFTTSFTQWNYKNLAAPKFLGFADMFKNYSYLFTKDIYFKTALLNSLKWAGLAAVIQVPFALVTALVLSKKPKLWRFTRNAYIIPNIISSAAIGLIFLNMYHPARGLVTLIIEKINPALDLNILAAPASAFWGVTFAFVLFGGTLMLLMLAQIMSIPKDLYEAAAIDGANGLKQDLLITLPLLKSAIGTSLILACNYGLLLYNEIALTSQGGPNGATYSLSYYIYKTTMGSLKLNFARGNAAGVVMFIIGILMVALINGIFNRDTEGKGVK